jgi:hypothetical protein
MSTLIRQRCSLHEGREAAVRCPSCKGYFCRECVTEYSGRMVCARCVSKIAAATERADSGWIAWSLFAVAGFLLTWLLLYYIGMGLAHIPSTFHGVY